MKSDFIVAVHALVYLTHLGTLVSSDELARNICTNPVRVRKIMGKLKKLGLVETKEGHVGGYAAVSGTEKATLLTMRMVSAFPLSIPNGGAGRKIWTASYQAGCPLSLTGFMKR